jgi:hypothetical protein
MADLEIGGTAGLETCATPRRSLLPRPAIAKSFLLRQGSPLLQFCFAADRALAANFFGFSTD